MSGRSTIFRLLISAAMAVTSALGSAQTAEPAAGVSRELASQRAGLIGDLEYALTLSVPATLAEPLRGSVLIRLILKDASQPLVIDFEPGTDHVERLEVNGLPAVFTQVNGHLVISAAALALGANSVSIDFQAGDAPLNRHADFLYSLFVPARARLALPCFDQPDLKGRWTLTLDLPAAWQSMANGAEEQRTVSGDRARVRFARTEPLPTYLVAFAAGHFKIETATRGGRKLRLFHRENDAAKVARNRDAIFDLHARALEFMERYTDIPYAFGKFDLIAVPSFQFGGMEHAGSIVYRASHLMLDESATQDQLLKRAEVIAHETAHMWFGDLVTMRWFDDVWTKEVFANFMAAKIVNPAFPTVNHELRFFLDHYRGAYQVDRSAGANPIGQELANLDQAGSLYGAIIYRKSPVVMRHLEALLGEVGLRDGLREYLKQHAFGNASWKELIATLGPRAPIDLQAWSRVWVEQPGRPLISTELVIRNGRIDSLGFRQADPRGRHLRWPQRLHVAFGGVDGLRFYDLELLGDRVSLPQVVGQPAPRYVLPAGGGWAYGDFALDRASLVSLIDQLPEIADPLTRASAWVTLWDGLLAGRLKPARFVDLALRALPRESDEQMVAVVLDYLTDAWWRYLDDDQRAVRTRRLETLLRERMDKAATPSRKSVWFAALRDVARSPATLAWLEQVWSRRQEIPGLPLAESDYSRLAQHLALRQVSGWRKILETQLGQIREPDLAARFRFVMPALSADRGVREDWFVALQDAANRRHEPWVLEGMRYLHHPLRAGWSERLIQPGLGMLRELQRTGDIFFPVSWLQVMLQGHNSPSAAQTVRKFCADLPADYPYRLRDITLQAADELFRAERLLGHPPLAAGSAPSTPRKGRIASQTSEATR